MKNDRNDKGDKRRNAPAKSAKPTTDAAKGGRPGWVTVFADITETFTKRVHMKVPADRAKDAEAIREAFEEACNSDDIDITRDCDEFSRDVEDAWSAADYWCDCAHCAYRDIEEGVFYCSALDKTVGMDECCGSPCDEYEPVKKSKPKVAKAAARSAKTAGKTAAATAKVAANAKKGGK